MADGGAVGSEERPREAVRPAGADDAPAVARIWEEGWPDGHRGHVPDALVVARTPDWFDRRAAQRIGDTSVAVVGGEVAGFTTVVGPEVEQVYVARRHRGTGIAAALLAEAERRVASAGHERAWLAVVAGNARARRFYERHGWHDDGAFGHRAPTDAGAVLVPARRYAKTVTSAI